MIKIDPFKQTDDSRCGPACIKMVLSYYGIEASEDEICDRANWSYELGCTDHGMKSAVESYGLECYIVNNASLWVLEHYLEHNIPVIVDWFSPGSSYMLSSANPLGDMPEGHSSIVVDIDEDYIYLLDPEFAGIRKILREDFMRVWFDWREDPYLQRCEDLILRQAMIIMPQDLRLSS